MKIKLAVSDEQIEPLTRFLVEHGIEIEEDAPFVLTETNRYAEHLTVRNEDRERCILAVSEILYIESYGHTIEVHTLGHVYQAMDPIYQLSYVLDPKIFLRISSSAIVNRTAIMQITPGFSRKFTLLMKDGVKLDVTRSYHDAFKEYLGI